MRQPLTLRKPDDFHLHLRDGKLLEAILPHSAQTFARTLVMPNLTKPILNAQQATAYKKIILQKYQQFQSLPNTPSPFIPLMTIFLTEETTLQDFYPQDFHFKDSENTSHPLERSVFAAKLYFATATTNTKHGVKNLPQLFPLLEQMEKHNLPLSIHGEIADDTTDVFDRESLFIDKYLEPLIARFPALRITLEHISTKKAVDFVREKARSNKLAATITPHHLLLNRNDLLGSGLRPHHYCLPIVKREEDRLALLEAAQSGERCFFLGTDSAPHTRSHKQAACGCAGIFNAPYAIECVFAALKPNTPSALECLERFTSENGATFHGLPPNLERITLVKQTQPYRSSLSVADEDIIVFTPPNPQNNTEALQVLRG